MTDVKILYKELLQPSEALVNDIGKLEGDIIILGVGGKMGPALATLTKQAIDKSGITKRVIGVSRFSEKGVQEQLDKEGIETYKADLLDEQELQTLPVVKNVIYMAGTKFGTTGKESLTWAMNTYLPGRVAEKYRNSRIVVFSTGNVYHLTPVKAGGATEAQLPAPVGEYAQSCLGRERVFQYFSSKYNTPILIFRLNYANDVTYGVLLDIARAVNDGLPIDLGMGYVNIIWQGEANEMALRSLNHCSVPAKILNIAGEGTLSVRKLAEEFGRMLEKKPRFINEEQSTALLSNATESFRLFGSPQVTLKKMMELLVAWIKEGGRTLNKPTHFQEREGHF